MDSLNQLNRSFVNLFDEFSPLCGAGIVKVSASLDSIPGGNVILDEK